MQRSMLTSGMLSIATIAAAVITANQRAAAEDAAPAPYEQTAVVEPPAECGAILALCVPTRGGLAVVTGANERYGAAPRGRSQQEPFTHRIVWFDAQGAETRQVGLDFSATVIAAAPQNELYVAGDGVVVRLSATGREVARGTTPQTPKTAEERAELENTLIEKRDAQLAAFDAQIERLSTAVAELENAAQEAEEAAVSPADEDGAEDGETDAERAEQLEKQRAARARLARRQAARMAAQLQSVRASAAAIQRQDPAELVAHTLRKTRQVRAVSGLPDGVLVVVGETSGYGCAAWQLDARLENPRKVLSGLVGCCSQMDVQVVGERLAIAANRKHCVELCSFAGEAIGRIGRRAASGDAGAGFGGCCNPMNTCPGPDGCLLTSESDGTVKRFDTDGAFVGIVGKAQVRGGCKNSAIAIEPDGSRLYYLDSTAGKVLVLTPAAQRADVSETADVEPDDAFDFEE